MKKKELFRRIVALDSLIAVVAVGVAAMTCMSTLGGASTTVTADKLLCDSLMTLQILKHDSITNVYMTCLDSIPPGGVRLDVDRKIVHGKEFNDSNYLHIREAQQLGIDPINCEADAWTLRRPVVNVTSCREYYIDNLTHSLPFLVPEAETLLRDIGRSFRDSLEKCGGGDYRIKVTSVLRTNSSIKRLRRRNGNAVAGSAHLYGTTFDISHSNFICDSLTTPRTVADMKMLLAEVLRSYRNAGRCYVKHERKQSCYHITVRKQES